MEAIDFTSAPVDSDEIACGIPQAPGPQNSQLGA
jgi:hypothetical protein